MDSTDFNKIAGGLIGAFLLYLLLNFASGQIYGTGEGGHHGEEPLAFALDIDDGGAGGGGGGGGGETTDYAALLASADVSKGEKVFKKCKSCHALEEGKNGVGPSLHGVVGRDVAAAPGFAFSSALTGMGGKWNLVELSGFLKDPKGYAPGTKMSFGGIKKDQDRVDLIAYLNEADGSPIELAATLPAAETDGDAKEDGAKEDGAADGVKPADGDAGDSAPKSGDDDAATGDEKDEGAKPEDDKSEDGSDKSEDDKS